MNNKIVSEILKNKKTCYFISPHLDDAALSAGEIMRYLATKTEVMVINVFTRPGRGGETLSAKKTIKTSQFRNAEELYKNRVQEDKKALEKINIKVVNLGFVEALWRKKKINNFILNLLSKFIPEFGHVYPMYRVHIQSDKISDYDSKLIEEIADRLKKTIKQNSVIFCPVAFGHIDHNVTRMAVERNYEPIYWMDQPYLQRGLSERVSENLKFIFEFETDKKQKEILIQDYKTQADSLFPGGKIPELKEIFYKQEKDQETDFPRLINNFKFIKRVIKDKKTKNFSYALYENEEGVKGFAKLWTGKKKNLDYLWLKNEIQVYKNIWEVIDSGIKTKSKLKVRVPQLYGSGDTDKSLFLLIEYIEGIRSGMLPTEKKVEVYQEILNFLKEVGSRLMKLNSVSITKRPSLYYPVLLPLISLIAMARFPKYIPYILLGMIKAFLLLPSLLVKRDLGLVHRDLGDWNIFLNGDQIMVIDFQLSSIAHRMLEYSTIYLKLWDQKEFVQKFSEPNNLFSRAQFQLLSIFLSIYDLSLKNGGPEKNAIEFLKFNLLPNFDLRIFFRNIKLLLDSPKDFIYSFTIPVNKKVIIEKYDPRISKQAGELIRKINSLLPELKVHFYGSSALKIYGQNDIDLFLESPTTNLQQFLPRLASMFGQPIKKKRQFTEWHLKKDRKKIDILLLSPVSPILLMQKKIYSLFKTDRSILKEYEALKIRSNGISSREYDRRQMEFFNRLLRQHKI